MHAYLISQIETFLNQGEDYNVVTYAQLLQRTMSESWTVIE